MAFQYFMTKKEYSRFRKSFLDHIKLVRATWGTDAPEEVKLIQSVLARIRRKYYR